MRGEYSVTQFFPDDQYEITFQFVDAETAVRGAVALTRSVGGQLGTTQRVIITDGGDSICWEWLHGTGVVFGMSGQTPPDGSRDLAEAAPPGPPPGWICMYCNTSNGPKDRHCVNCGKRNISLG